MRNKWLVRNKICALIFVCTGLISALMDNDDTFFIFSIMMAGILFFSKKDLMTEEENINHDN